MHELASMIISDNIQLLRGVDATHSDAAASSTSASTLAVPCMQRKQCVLVKHLPVSMVTPYVQQSVS